MGEDGTSLAASGFGQWRLEGTTCVTSEGGDEEELNPLRVPSAAQSISESQAFQRPTAEVFATVEHIFKLQGAPQKLYNHILKLTASLVDGQCPVSELSTFFTYLRALLCKLFAGIIDTETPEDENPLASLLEESVVQDLVAAARVSLSEYHQQAQKKKRGFMRRKVSLQMPLKQGSSDADSNMKRKLSCYTPKCSTRDRFEFAAAFAGGKLDAKNAAPKHRPDSRIDRTGSTMNNSMSIHSYSAAAALSGRYDRPCDRSSSTPPQPCASPKASLLSPARRHGLDHGLASPAPSINQSSLCLSQPPCPSDESATQYFDIIIETVCVIIAIKYEHQIMELTLDGEGCGVRRSAEWLAARMLDEMYNDGIDPTQALCTQMILLAEGLAFEDGAYVWRTCGSVDQEVMYVVWGEPPEDVLQGQLQIKGGGEGEVWYEWGAFVQPGVRTVDGRLYTGPRLNPLLYRYRLASPEIAESLGLTDTKTAPLRAPSFLNRRPGKNICTSSGDCFVGVTLSAPPEGSAHKGGTIPRPHIRPQSASAQVALEEKYMQRYAPDAYCDTYVSCCSVVCS